MPYKLTDKVRSNDKEYLALPELFEGFPNVTRARAMHITQYVQSLRKWARGEVNDENLLEHLEELPITRARAYHMYHSIQSLRKTIDVCGSRYEGRRSRQR